MLVHIGIYLLFTIHKDKPRYVLAIIAYQSDGRCRFLSRALLSFSDFCLS
jgi:hypothetical protein